MANQGWQCPECKTVYAPHVEKCECSVMRAVSSGSTKEVPIPRVDIYDGRTTVPNNQYEAWAIRYDPSMRIFFGAVPYIECTPWYHRYEINGTE